MLIKNWVCQGSSAPKPIYALAKDGITIVIIITKAIDMAETTNMGYLNALFALFFMFCSNSIYS